MPPFRTLLSPSLPQLKFPFFNPTPLILYRLCPCSNVSSEGSHPSRHRPANLLALAALRTDRLVLGTRREGSSWSCAASNEECSSSGQYPGSTHRWYLVAALPVGAASPAVGVRAAPVL